MLPDVTQLGSNRYCGVIFGVDDGVEVRCIWCDGKFVAITAIR